MDNLKETKGGCAFVLKVMDRDLLNDSKCSETEPTQLSQCIDLDSQDVNNNNYDHRNNIKIGELGSIEITAKDDEYSSDESIVFDSELEETDKNDSETSDDEDDSETSDDDSEDDFNPESSNSKVIFLKPISLLIMSTKIALIPQVRFNLIPKFHMLRVWKFAAKEARIDYHWKNLQHTKMRLQNF